MGAVLGQTFPWTISQKDSLPCFSWHWPSESCKLCPHPRPPPAPRKGDYLSSRPVDPNFSSENLEEKKKTRSLAGAYKKMHVIKSYMNSSGNSFQGSLKVIQAAVVFPVGSQTLHSNSQAPWLKTHRLGPTLRSLLQGCYFMLYDFNYIWCNFTQSYFYYYNPPLFSISD